MIIATGLIVTITTSASTLGSKWSGLLSPFPIFTFVMATFSHYQGGAAAASRLIRGVLVGLFSYTTFFLVVALLVDKTSFLIVYPLATVAALGVDGISSINLPQKQSHTFIPTLKRLKNIKEVVRNSSYDLFLEYILMLLFPGGLFPLPQSLRPAS